MTEEQQQEEEGVQGIEDTNQGNLKFKKIFAKNSVTFDVSDTTVDEVLGHGPSNSRWQVTMGSYRLKIHRDPDTMDFTIYIPKNFKSKITIVHEEV